MKNIYCILIALLPSLTYAFFCPGSFNQIDLGMSKDEVILACGKPDTQKEYEKKNENIPQEWSYFVPQTVSMNGYNGQNASGTLKTSISFDDKGKAVNISVNGIGVGATAICGSNIQLGTDKDTIKRACGTPSFVTKQTRDTNPNLVESTKITEFNYSSATPPMTLIFEDGRLTERQ